MLDQTENEHSSLFVRMDRDNDKKFFKFDTKNNRIQEIFWDIFRLSFHVQKNT